MRRFHSYGPVDERKHFTTSRKELVHTCLENLVGDPEEGGHYFTIWAPRQAGKTWLMRQVSEEIRTLYADKFIIANMSCQGIIIKDGAGEDEFLKKIPKLMLDGFDIDIQPPETWEEWILFFHKRKGIFKKPILLFIDEFDSLPAEVIDRIVTLFRDVYLNRDDYFLHGLSLIGVCAVLGVESERGSPFNIQRSLHIPNFTEDEVEDLFSQYQEESGQKIDTEVVKRVYDVTRGQPGIVCWFGELLTEKYNPGKDKAIQTDTWEDVYRLSCAVEWNNTVLNLIKKARGEYCSRILELFSRSDIPFTLDAEWCSYMYLHGIIDYETSADSQGVKTEICRFSNPFIHLRIFNALTNDIVGDRIPILALEPLDDLSDVFGDSTGSSTGLNLPALLERYKSYLKRLKAKGLNPWKDQPRRSDLHITEYVGHFHLYFWLQNAVGRRCVISPEFPTGNGRVDLHLKCGEKRSIIEVKSFRNMYELEDSREQAARYAAKLGLDSVTLAVFVPTDDENILNQLSGEKMIGDLKTTVSAIGWV
ncbi:MAG: hypothetical protein BWK80_39530 [Desulfobacteraceae bacterium IS3]|nr:MAG: hypothetical protein BWK80_39530 [Desulfobacteraceae bacterium IS3]